MNVKNLVLGIGIFVVFMLMLSYGIEAFYPSPKYNDFCKNDYYGATPAKYYGISSTNCTYPKELQQQESNCSMGAGMPVYNYDTNGCAVSATCDYCNVHYTDAEKTYSGTVFIIAIIIGIITLLLGYSVLFVEPVGSSLMASGVGAIFYGSIRNWANLSNIWRFLLLLVSLVLLIWIALRLNRESKGKKRK